MRLVAFAFGPMTDEERAVKQMSEEDRQAVCDWYRLHGVDPNTVPADHELVYLPERLAWRVERYIVEGRALAFDGDIPRYHYVFDEVVPFPAIGSGGVFE